MIKSAALAIWRAVGLGSSCYLEAINAVPERAAIGGRVDRRVPLATRGLFVGEVFQAAIDRLLPTSGFESAGRGGPSRRTSRSAARGSPPEREKQP